MFRKGIYMHLSSQQMGSESLCFRVVRPSVCACVCARIRPGRGIPDRLTVDFYCCVLLWTQFVGMQYKQKAAKYCFFDVGLTSAEKPPEHCHNTHMRINYTIKNSFRLKKIGNVANRFFLASVVKFPDRNGKPYADNALINAEIGARKGALLMSTTISRGDYACSCCSPANVMSLWNKKRNGRIE